MQLKIKLEGLSSDTVLSAKETAQLLGTSEGALNTWRVTGRGPHWRKHENGRVGYVVRDIEKWFNERRPWTKPGLLKNAA